MKEDILRCPDCGEVICINLSPKLSKISRQHLIQRYRDMLATSHAEHCTFRNDSEKWLLTKGKMKDNLYNGFTVPPYLLSLSNEFHLFEHANSNGLALMDTLSKVAIEISRALDTKLNEKKSSLDTDDIPLPKSATNLVAEQFEEENGFVSTFTKALQKMSVMNTNEKQGNSVKVTNDGALLSCFGWRLLGKS